MICELRSSKMDGAIVPRLLGDVDIEEYTIPGLGNNDIDGILDVLDRNRRLGVLRQMTRESRVEVFRRQAGRQLLVAMHYATNGVQFEEKVEDEMNNMDVGQKFIYGVVSIASAHRFVLNQEDIGIGCGTSDLHWLRVLRGLCDRRIIVREGQGRIRARHRIIAQFAYDALVEQGTTEEIVYALLQIGAANTTHVTLRQSRHMRMLKTFVNHNFMQRVLGDIPKTRRMYGQFEDALNWNYHFWLHRGAVEVESGRLG